MNTKACSLTKDEVMDLIYSHSSSLGANDLSISLEDRIERINYFHKRLKAFNEVEMKPEPEPETKMTDTQADAIGAASKGW